MEVLYFLIPISLIFVALGVAIFFWAVKSGQYEDLEGPAHRILFDDDQPVRDPSAVAGKTAESRTRGAEQGAGKD